MQNIALVVGALILAFLAQVVWWRLRRPSRQLFSLLLLFAVVFVVSWWAARRWDVLDLPLADIARLALLYASFALTYTILFSAVEISSPTLSLVSYIGSMGQRGCSEDELIGRFIGEGGMMERLELMELSGLIRIDNGRCELTEKGFLFARLFEFGAWIFGLAQGG